MEFFIGDVSLWLFHPYGLTLACIIMGILHFLAFSLVDLFFSKTPKINLLGYYAIFIILSTTACLLMAIVSGVEIRFSKEPISKVITYILWSNERSYFIMSNFIIGCLTASYVLKHLITTPEKVERYKVVEFSPEEEEEEMQGNKRRKAQDAVFSLENLSVEESEEMGQKEETEQSNAKMPTDTE